MYIHNFGYPLNFNWTVIQYQLINFMDVISRGRRFGESQTLIINHADTTTLNLAVHIFKVTDKEGESP